MDLDYRLYEIIVIDDDKIVERGTHESLLQTPGGIYASLYSAQFHLV